MDIDDLPPPVPSSARPSVTLTPPDDDTADVPVVMRTSATSSATRSDPSTLATPTADYDGNENDDDDDWWVHLSLTLIRFSGEKPMGFILGWKMCSLLCAGVVTG